jgi:hypothetical protein
MQRLCGSFHIGERRDDFGFNVHDQTVTPANYASKGRTAEIISAMHRED